MSKLTKCVDQTGKCLRECNEDIVKKLCELIEQRDELVGLIEGQYEEKKKIETELEKLTYKLCLVNKSLYQRLKTKSQYDKTIDEIEKHYKKLIDNSTTLRDMLEQHHSNLEEMMNKKSGTDPNDEGEVKVLYAKKWIETVESGTNRCHCDNMPSKETAPRVIKSEPTKDDQSGSTRDESEQEKSIRSSRESRDEDKAGNSKRDVGDIEKAILRATKLHHQNGADTESDTQQQRKFSPPPKTPTISDLPPQGAKETPVKLSLESEGSEMRSTTTSDSQEPEKVQEPQLHSDTGTISSMRSGLRKSDTSGSSTGKKAPHWQATSLQPHQIRENDMLLEQLRESVDLPAQPKNPKKTSFSTDVPVNANPQEHKKKNGTEPTDAPVIIGPKIDTVYKTTTTTTSTDERTSEDLSVNQEIEIELKPGTVQPPLRSNNSDQKVGVKPRTSDEQNTLNTSLVLKQMRNKFKASTPKEATKERPRMRPRQP